jgi:ParB-like chromosome segregation protein Spo0J
MKTEKVKIELVKSNADNPRIIKHDKFKKLVKSIQDFPKMLELRPIVVDEDMIVLGGNMRLKACQEAGLKEVFIIKANELTSEQKKEFIIKDNVGFGEWDWDILANEWDNDLLVEWGLDTVFANDELPLDDAHIDDSVETIIVIGVKNINDIDKITDFYNLKSTNLTAEMKDQLVSQRKVYVFE